MADTPTPRSYQQIVGSMIAAFLSKYPIPQLKVGGPVLSTLEAAAQSDLRNTADIFKFLASTSLDNTSGQALQQQLADANTQLQGATAATGKVTITDSRYAKQSSTIYFAKPAPLIGSNAINVPNAANWPSSGFIYIGRGTANYEGPLQYNSITPNGSYYTINLASTSLTKNFHNLGESVILAQGGNRPISVGQLVATSSTISPVQYTVQYNYVIPDGEISLSGVQIKCTQAGTVGNAPIGAINTFPNPPFTGAQVSNPLSFDNGYDAETEDQGRARLRLIRQAAGSGTDAGIEASLAGIVASDESKRITSIAVVHNQGQPTLTVVDDGTGYEEISTGVPYEILTPSAVGGEIYFQLSLGRPVTKAYLQSVEQEPFILVDGSVLAVLVGGQLQTVTFHATDFRNIQNAAAYEIAHAINAAAVGFSARLSNGGTNVSIYANSDTNEDLTITSLVGYVDANQVLRFPQGNVNSVSLYKNDMLLSKDGKPALIAGNAQSSWGALSDPSTLIINVDGTGAATYSFTASDFVNAGTGYNTLNTNNSLAAWAAVLNYKIPGITASVSGNYIQLVSNAGSVARGSLSITGGTMVSGGVFSVSSSKAKVQDYIMNRNTGQLKLNVPLNTGDKLTAGSPYTNAFIEIPLANSVTTTSTGYSYWIVNGNAQPIILPVTGSTTFTETTASASTGPVHLVLTSNNPVFANVAVGDWCVMSDANFANFGAARISHVVSAYSVWMLMSSPVAGTPNITLATAGLAVVRSTSEIQKVSLAAGTYTAQSLASAITLTGATASVVRTGYCRVTTNDPNGDICYVIGTAAMGGFPFVANTEVHSQVSAEGFVQSQQDNAVPVFAVSSATGGTSNTISNTTLSISKGRLITGLRTLVYDTTHDGYGNALGFESSIQDQTSTTITLRQSAPDWVWNNLDRFFESHHLQIGPHDDLTVLLDNNVSLKNFNVAFSRKVDVSLSTYSSAGMVIRDADYNNSPFGVSFGSTFSFNDYALYMHPRVISNATTTKEILWRWNGMGRSGEGVAVDYAYPAAANSALNWNMLYGQSSPTNNILQVVLPSGNARSLSNFDTTFVPGILPKGAVGSISHVYLYTGLQITAWTMTSGTVTVTVEPPDNTTLAGFNHGLSIGQQVYLNLNPSQPITSQLVTITATPAANTFQYVITPAPADATSTGYPTAGNFGFMYFDNPGGITIDWTGVVVGDVIYINGLGGSNYSQPMYVNAIPNIKVLDVYVPVNGIASSTTMAWTMPNQNLISVYPVSITATALVAGITSAWPVTALLQNSGGPGTISTATWVDQTSITSHPNLFVDGLNYVKTTYPASSPSNFSIDLKNTVSSALGAYPNWITEEVYLVPINSACVVSFLNSMAVTGLGQNSTIALVGPTYDSFQIATDTQGSSGSVEVLGGLANQATATIIGNAALSTDSSVCYVAVPTSEVTGFWGKHAVQIVNNIGEIKPTTYGYNQNLSSISGHTWTYSNYIGNYAIASSCNWQFEFQGAYMAMVWNGQGTVPGLSLSPGDYIVIEAVGADTVSPNNQGQFTVVAFDVTSQTVWYQNPNGVEERSVGTVVGAARASVMPGDILNVGTTAWGAANQTAFTVATVNYSTKLSFTTVQSAATSGAVATVQPLVTLRAGTPLSLVKTLNGIVPINSTTSIVTFADTIQNAAIAQIYGSEIVALSKLNFGTGISTGKDGYDYSTGLIGEANKVLYGLATDPVTYPGVLASGVNVNIAGPTVRRIVVSLAVRIINGAVEQDVFDGIRSALTTFINSLGVGVSVALSDVISTASYVSGVQAISILSPVYSSTSDLIPVQPYEKAMVLDPDLDITLALIS